MTDTDAKSVRISCADGWVLDVVVRLPDGPPRAVAICGHAMMVDRRTMDVRGEGVVSTLVRAGIAVLHPDLRGHGRSGPLAVDGGRWSYDDIVYQDVPALHAMARDRFPGLPLFDVGHSLYGHAALAYAARYPERCPDGFVLLAANAWVRECEPSLRVWLEKRALVATMWTATRAAGHFPARTLRMGNTDEAYDYVAQFDTWLGSGDWTDRQGFSWWRALPAIRVPVLAIAGAADRILCRPASAERFCAPLPHATYRWAGRSRLGPEQDGLHRAHRLPLDFDPDHMGVCTDPRSRPIWEQAAHFILSPPGFRT